MTRTLDATRVRPDYNLGFERLRPDGSPDVWIWFGGAAGYSTAICDTVISRTGRASLRIIGSEAGGVSVLKQTSGIVNALRGKQTTFSAWVRMEGSVTAEIAMRATALPDTILFHREAKTTNLGGATDWQRLSLTVDVDTSAVDLEFGVFMFGTGTTWFDDLEIDTNGVVYAK